MVRRYVIIEVPKVPAIAIPLVDPIVATLVLLLLHVPPVGAPVNVVVPYVSHISRDPVIAVGIGCTVTVTEAAQPVPRELVIMAVDVVSTPGLPVTTPEASTVATEGSLEVQLLPDAPESVMLEPAHTCNDGAVGAVGSGNTVCVRVMKQPEGSVYVTLTVSGPLRPQNTPLVLPMDPIAELLLVHMPPVGVLLSVVHEPTHTADDPPMAAGNA